MLAGAGAMVSAMILPFAPLAALPWAALTWPPATLAGYRIWRARNPEKSATAEIRRRARAAGTALITIAAIAFAEAYPEILIAIIVIWGALILGLLALVSLAERGVRTR
jgi:hypothetical protein